MYAYVIAVHIITKFGYPLFGKVKIGSTKVEMVDHILMLQTGEP